MSSHPDPGPEHAVCQNGAVGRTLHKRSGFLLASASYLLPCAVSVLIRNTQRIAGGPVFKL